ncbi:MAG: outer membrane protein [Rhodospirillales bacterium]
MMYLRRASLAALILASGSAVAAAAELPRGVYAGIVATYVWPPESTVEDARNPGGADGRLTFQHDFGYGVMVGYSFGNGLRVEGEAMMRQIDNDQLFVGGFGSARPVANLNGDLTHYTAMVNVFYDPVRWGWLIPYVGGGMGISKATIDSSGIGLDASDYAFAYQAMAGVRMAVMPELFFSVGYKYFATTDLQLAGSTLDFHSSNLEFGLAWQF